MDNAEGKGRPRVSLVIPALNEAAAIPLVLKAVPPQWVDEVIVVDNGSTDGTGAAAEAGGARVVREETRGYGAACLAGAAAASEPGIILFMDADFSDDPGEIPALVRPLAAGEADLVIGSRTLGRRERGALLPQARLGNALAACLIRLLFGFTVSDLGPFRGLTTEAFRRLAPTDTGFGFPCQTQVRAIAMGLKVTEVAVSYRRRIGRSKISGTLRGSFLAGRAILTTIFREYRRGSPRPAGG